MPLKKVKIKNLFSNSAKLIFLSFNFKSFWGHFVTKQVGIFEIGIKLSIFIPFLSYFKKNKFHLSEGPFYKFSYT
jgi:hypothetical protein